MKVYFLRHWPAELVFKFAQKLTQHRDCEFVLKVSAEIVLRDLHPKTAEELHRLCCEHLPPDGVHLCFGQSALLFDLDFCETSPPRKGICECTAESHSICDRCWLALVCSAQLYESVLKGHYGFEIVQSVFSGGRGIHLYVLDTAVGETLRHTIASQISSVVRDLLAFVKANFPDICAAFMAGQGTVDYNCSVVTRTHLILDDSAPTSERLCTQAAPQFVVSAYESVLVPFFTRVWTPRLCGSASTGAKGLHFLHACVSEWHESACKKDASCADCTLLTLWKHFNRLRALDHETAEQSLFARFDVFVLLTRMFWFEADLKILEQRHLIRLPFSPHSRSGLVSVPIDLRCADTLALKDFPSVKSAQDDALFKCGKSLVKSCTQFYYCCCCY